MVNQVWQTGLKRQMNWVVAEADLRGVLPEEGLQIRFKSRSSSDPWKQLTEQGHLCQNRQVR